MKGGWAGVGAADGILGWVDLTETLCYNVKMKKNPKPLIAIKGTVTREAGAKPKPHEYITAEALADAGYNVRFIPSRIHMRMADCYVNNTIYSASIE